MTDLSATIDPKVDQLTADHLLGGPITVKVTNVTGSDSPEQPISIHYEGGEGYPFKPCRTMRRLLVHLWGPDGTKYAGRSLTLYRDPAVAFGGLVVGGVRISHASHIDKEVTLALTQTRGKKKPVKVLPLKVASEPTKPEPTDDAEVFDLTEFSNTVEKYVNRAIDPDALTAWWDSQKPSRLQARAADKTKAGEIATRVAAKIAELTADLEGA